MAERIQLKATYGVIGGKRHDVWDEKKVTANLKRGQVGVMGALVEAAWVPGEERQRMLGRFGFVAEGQQPPSEEPGVDVVHVTLSLREIDWLRSVNNTEEPTADRPGVSFEGFAPDDVVSVTEALNVAMTARYRNAPAADEVFAHYEATGEVNTALPYAA